MKLSIHRAVSHDYLKEFCSIIQAHKRLVEKRNQEMAERSKEHAEKLRAERLKKLENYEEPEWMKMENLEGSLKEIEANLDQAHGCEAGMDQWTNPSSCMFK